MSNSVLDAFERKDYEIARLDAEISDLRSANRMAHDLISNRDATIAMHKAVLIHTRTFLKTYQRTNANWHNDQPTWDFIRTILDPVIDDFEQETTK